MIINHIRKIKNIKLRMILGFPIALMYFAVDWIKRKGQFLILIPILVIIFGCCLGTVEFLEKLERNRIEYEAVLRTERIRLLQEEFEKAAEVAEEVLEPRRVIYIPVPEEEEVDNAQVMENDTTQKEEQQNIYQTDEFRYKAQSYAEGGIDGEKAVRAIMHVIHNRTQSSMERYGSTVYEVLSLPGQFDSFINGRPHILLNGGTEKILITEEMLPDFVHAAYDAFQEEIANGQDFTRELLKQEALRLGITDPKYWEDGALYFYNPNFLGEQATKERSGIKVKVMIGSQYFYCYWDQPVQVDETANSETDESTVVDSNSSESESD